MNLKISKGTDKIYSIVYWNATLCKNVKASEGELSKIIPGILNENFFKKFGLVLDGRSLPDFSFQRKIIEMIRVHNVSQKSFAERRTFK